MAGRIKFINKIAAAVIAVMIFIFSSMVSGGTGAAFAAATATPANSSVLSDLSKDPGFDPANYPSDAADYSINVIQIAEGDRGYLYVYTYQPCQLTRYLVATDINMSLSESADGTKLYGLTLVNTSGVFAKYLVKDVKVSDASTRYYNISSIYREWDTDLDGETGTNNTGDKRSFPVAKLFKATTENGQAKYTCDPTYVVNILNPYSDYLLYITAMKLPTLNPLLVSLEAMGMMDAHYIAFSTDMQVDRLKSATVTYQYRTATGYYNTFLGFDVGADVTFGSEQTGYAYPKYDDKVEIEGWYAVDTCEYSWDRIQTVAEFISTEEDLTEETIANLEGKQWVLRFLETQRTQTTTNVLGYKKYTTEYTKVDKVTVLRLEFETDGVTYNLGTVSDTVSGDVLPGNVDPIDDQSFFAYVWSCIVKLFKGTASTKETIVAVIAIVVALMAVSILLTVLSIFFPVVGKVLLWIVKGIGYFFKYLFIGIWYIISAPFRLIVWIVEKRKGGGGNTE